MKLLLDTSAFIKLVQGAAIPERAKSAIEDPNNCVFVSLVTPWEMQIKLAINKLKLSQPVRSIIDAQLCTALSTCLG